MAPISQRSRVLADPLHGYGSSPMRSTPTRFGASGFIGQSVSEMNETWPGAWRSMYWARRRISPATSGQSPGFGSSERYQP